MLKWEISYLHCHHRVSFLYKFIARRATTLSTNAICSLALMWNSDFLKALLLCETYFSRVSLSWGAQNSRVFFTLSVAWCSVVFARMTCLWLAWQGGAHGGVLWRAGGGFFVAGVAKVPFDEGISSRKARKPSWACEASLSARLRMHARYWSALHFCRGPPGPFEKPQTCKQKSIWHTFYLGQDKYIWWHWDDSKN